MVPRKRGFFMSGHPVLPAERITLPLLPLRDVVVFPHMVIPLFVGRPKSIKALESAMEAGRQIMLVAQKAAGKDEPKPDDMFEVGCVSSDLADAEAARRHREGAGRRHPAREHALASVTTASTFVGRPHARRPPSSDTEARRSKRCAARSRSSLTSTSS